MNNNSLTAILDATDATVDGKIMLCSMSRSMVVLPLQRVIHILPEMESATITAFLLLQVSLLFGKPHLSQRELFSVPLTRGQLLSLLPLRVLSSKDIQAESSTPENVEPLLTMPLLLLVMVDGTKAITTSSETHGVQHGEMLVTSTLLHLEKDLLVFAVFNHTPISQPLSEQFSRNISLITKLIYALNLRFFNFIKFKFCPIFL